MRFPKAVLALLVCAAATARAQSLPPPANDSFASREALSGVGVEFGGSLATATSEEGEPEILGTLHRTRWWTWTAPSNGTARIANFADGAPSTVGIYREGGLFHLMAVADSQTEFGNECTRFWRGRDAVEWDTVAGQAYEIQLDRDADADMDQVFRMKLSFVPVPANDDASTATELVGADLSLDVDNFGATFNPLDPVVPGETGAGSVWYHWALPGRGMVQVTTNQPVRFAEPSFEIVGSGGSLSGTGVTIVYIYTVPPCSGPIVDLHPLPRFAPVFGIYDSNESSEGRPLLRLRAAGTNAIASEVSGDAWIQFDGHGGTSGQTKMNVLFTPPPSNDDFANRIVLPSTAVKVGGRTFAATADAGEEAKWRSVWWEWKAPTTGAWVLRPKVTDSFVNYIMAPGSTRPNPFDAPVRTGAKPALFHASAGQVFSIGAVTIGGVLAVLPDGSLVDVGVGGNASFVIEPALSAPLRIVAGGSPRFDPRHPVLAYPPGFDLPFVVEASSNLVDWVPLGANANNGSGSFGEVLPEAPATRFYRTRVVAP